VPSYSHTSGRVCWCWPYHFLVLPYVYYSIIQRYFLNFELQTCQKRDISDCKAHDRRPKFSVQETRTRNSHENLRMSCILARVFSCARNLFRVGHSSIPSKFLVRVSRMSLLDGELGSSVMGLSCISQCLHIGSISVCISDDSFDSCFIIF